MKTKEKISLSPLNEALIACKSMIKYSLLFGCIINLLMLATPIYSMQVLDRVISSSNTNTLVMLTIVIVFAILLLGALQVARSLSANMMGNWFERTLSSKIFSNAVLQTSGRSAGGSQQLRDLQTIKTFLTSPSLISILDVPWAIIFIIVLFIIHTYMGVLTIVGGLVLITMAFVTDKLTKPLHEKSNEQFVTSMRQVDQASRNSEVIKVMGLLPNVLKNWQMLNFDLQSWQYLVSTRQTVLSEFTKFFRMTLQILVTGLGAYLVLQQEMSVGAIIACSSLSGRALAPFEGAINSLKGMVNARKSYNRLEESLEGFNETHQVKTSLPAPEGHITAENLFYTPPGSQKHIIKGVSFEAKPGEILAIIGPSASGKTSLAKLIVGAYKPHIGTIRIDNANLEDWNKDELGQHFGYLPQNVELFSGTVKENIARLDKEAKDEDVLHASNLANVHDLVLSLPKAYDTEIGMDGGILSGGQKQRVGLARAFYNDPKILVLDEPNANLDSFGEQALNVALQRAKDMKMTTIIISHRTSILGAADKILVMKDGSVAMFGPKDDVLKKLQSSGQQPPQPQPQQPISKPEEPKADSTETGTEGKLSIFKKKK